MHWCRWPIAAAVATGCYLAMTPDTSLLGRARWSCARVQQWLAADDSPLQRWRLGGSAPPLQIDLRTSPPLDQTHRDAVAATCTAGLTASTDGTRGVLLVPVYVGDVGVRAEIAVPDGTGAVLQARFPSGWPAIGVAAIGAIAVLGWPRRRAAG